MKKLIGICMLGVVFLAAMPVQGSAEDVSMLYVLEGNKTVEYDTFNDTNGDSEESSEYGLIKKLKSKISKEIVGVYYSDYDGDGKGEIFAAVGKKTFANDTDSHADELWFASSKEVVCLSSGQLSICQHGTKNNEYGIIFKVNNKQRLFKIETSGHGSGSSSFCWYVKNGRAYEVDLRGSMDIRQISGKDFSIIHQDFDRYSSGGGHTYKRYYIKWTGSSFIEYKAKKISLSKLKKFKGSKDILKRIKKSKYRVTTVYKRSNGLINVNVKRKAGYGGYDYENVTLRIKGNRVSVVIQNKKGKGIVARSSYGGVYKAVGFKKGLSSLH